MASAAAAASQLACLSLGSRRASPAPLRSLRSSGSAPRPLLAFSATRRLTLPAPPCPPGAARAALAGTVDAAEAAPRTWPPLASCRIHGTGRRKTAVARVALLDGGAGQIQVNGLTLHEYFQGQPLMIQAVKLPLSSLGYEGKFDLLIKVHGGGLNAQAQAMVMGIARALCMANAANRPPLKAQGMLTRDSRAVERKKYGLKKARKAPQYSKR
eukprot:SM000362S13781  [mRNA]  locus=s362:65589:66520:+ [translate_table: standard]